MQQTAAVDAAERFFMVALPTMVARNLEKFASMRGNLGFSIKGKGKWTLQFGDVETPVRAGMDRTADVRVFFTPITFERFVQGSLDVAKAMDDDQLHASGDARLLDKFAFLMNPPSSPLGARLDAQHAD